MTALAKWSSSIRTRLAVVNLVVLGLVLLITLGVAAVSAEQAARSATDQSLREAAGRISSRLEHERHEKHERYRETIAIGGERSLIVVVADEAGVVQRADGNVVPSGLPEPSGLAAARAGREHFSDAVVDDEPMRVYSAPLRSRGNIVGALQIAKSTAESGAAMRRTLLILALTGGVGLLLAAFGSAFLAVRAMRPIDAALRRQRGFIADASHELRTPVAIIRARAELLSKEGAASPTTRAELEQLVRDSGELSDLLSRMLDLARLDAEDKPLALAPTPLGDVAEEVVSQLAPLARETSVTLAAEPSSVFVVAHLTSLRQVVRALVDNAIKHSAEGGSVRLVMDVERGRGRLRVVDEGSGIAAADLPNVKERFFRADPSRTRGGAKRGGAGLGLAIAHELVARMNGELTLESAEGRGTTATVSLPLA